MVEDKFAGRKLDERYHLQRRLDAGSFGAVYEAVDLNFDSTVAVKILFDQNLESASAFRKEARLARQFQHSNVVTVFDYGSDRKLDVGYIVMEFLRGRRLDQLIVPGQPAVDYRMIAKFTDEIGSALQSAHERQLVHRDLKPRNVMLVDEGTSRERFVLLDLGLASQTDSTATLRNQTLDGAMTPHYASPEQFNQGAVDFRSDIYSFGTVLYELVTGRIPFPRDQLLGMMMAICNEPPPAMSEVAADREIPPELNAVIMECLEKSPDRRPESMQIVRQRVLASMGFSTGFYERSRSDTTSGGRSPGTAQPTRPPGSGFDPGFEMQETMVPRLPGTDSGITGTIQPDYAGSGNATGTLQPGQAAATDVSGTLQPTRPAGDTDRQSRRNASWARPQTRRAEPTARPYLLAALVLIPAAIVAAVMLIPSPSINGNGTPDPPLTPDPLVWTPPEGFQAVAGLDPVASHGDDRLFPPWIERVLDNDLRVRFRLIPTPANVSREWDIEPFYIMETKVWNALFEQYWQAAGAAEFTAAGSDMWKLGAQAGSDDLLAAEHPQHPVFRVTAPQAWHFAIWLGGDQLCHLPSPVQWKLAAGLPQWDTLPEAQRNQWSEGPYLGQWQDGQLDIAVNRPNRGPLPVATAAADISFTECRDMAGNGAELTEKTRDNETVGPSIVLSENPHDAQPRVLVLGQEYNKHEPLTWQELRSPPIPNSTGYTEFSAFISFRVVLEID